MSCVSVVDAVPVVPLPPVYVVVVVQAPAAQLVTVVEPVDPGGAPSIAGADAAPDGAEAVLDGPAVIELAGFTQTAVPLTVPDACPAGQGVTGAAAFVGSPVAQAPPAAAEQVYGPYTVEPVPAYACIADAP